MLPLADWPIHERALVQGVLADIDDTLTTDGRISGDALASLHALKEAGFIVVLVTGRPAGWSKPFAESWPVDAIVDGHQAPPRSRSPASIMILPTWWRAPVCPNKKNAHATQRQIRMA